MGRSNDDLSALQDMVSAMRNKLAQNHHKPHWRDDSMHTLMTRLVEEATELADAIAVNAPPEDVWLEAADVANYAMFTARVYELERRTTR